MGKGFYIGFVFTINGKMNKEQLPQLGVSKIDSRNRITLSTKVLDALNLESGDYVSVENHDGVIRLLKAYLYVRRNKNASE